LNNDQITGLTVYWQPGCSSCLRAKEFLSSNGIEFSSVNVREDETAMERLSALGARSIPVITRKEEFVYAQDIDVLADFIGLKQKRKILPANELVIRIDLILAAAQRYLPQLRPKELSKKLPGRDRTYLDLAYHVFVIPEAFLDAANGKELTFEHFERTPPADIASTIGVIEFGRKVRENMQTWWRSVEEEGLPHSVLTYYGQHSTHSVLERTAWHTAQHVRQLMELVSQQGTIPDGPLGERELAGLPLPDEIYDDEIKLGSE
jgi:glutaredoxin